MHRKETIEAELQQFILRHFPVARQHHVGLHDSLLELGIVDSLGVLELVTFIEKDLGVTLSDDELMPEHFTSIATIADLVTRRLDPEGAV
jgi:acyl carrier protein